MNSRKKITQARSKAENPSEDSFPSSFRQGLANPVFIGICLILLVLGIFLGSRLGSPPTGSASGTLSSAGKPEVWTCAMHPQIKQPKPGKCPICFMDLVPLDTGAGEEGARELSLSQTAIRLAEIRTAPIKRGAAVRSLRMVGTIAFDETRFRNVSAWVEGRIDRLFVNYTGLPVKRGEHMAEIYSPMLISAHQELLQGRGRPELLNAARQRLLRWGILPDQVREMENATAPARHLTVPAPIGGVVVRKMVNEGMYVGQGESLFSIADLSRVWLLIAAYESDIRWLRFGQTVSFAADAIPGERFLGMVSFIDPVLDEKTRTVPVRVTVDNSDGRLKPGMFVRAAIEVPVTAGGEPALIDLAGKWVCPMHPEVIKSASGPCDVCEMPVVPASTQAGSISADMRPLLVPDTAPLWTGTRSVVYRKVSGKDASYEAIEVDLGPRVDGAWVVLGGLAEGDDVVVNGAFKIDSELQIRAKPSMMSPGGGSAEASGHAGHAMPGGEAPRPPTSIPAPGGASEAKTALVELVDAALGIARALSEDDLNGARTKAETGVNATARVPETVLSSDQRAVWASLSNDVNGGFMHIRGASDLQSARGGLRHLTSALDRLLETFGQPTTSMVTKMHCPMAFDNQGAYWYQVGTLTANPYFGVAMPRCGEKIADLPPTP